MTELGAERIGLTRESTISMRVVRGLVEAAEQAGVAPDKLLRAAQLGIEQLESLDARIPRSQVYQLCEVAIDLTGDPALGLHWAESFGESTFVPISHLIAHSGSLRQGFESLTQFYRLLSDQASYEFIEHEDKVTVRCRRLTGESARTQRFCTEMMVVGFLRLFRCVSIHARPERVSFEYAAPSYHAEYTRIFEGMERFEQPFSGIVFERSLLDVPTPHKDDDIHEVLQALAERRLSRITRTTPYALRVRELLVRQGWPNRADMQTVAHALGMSVRSLRRRLSAEGKSYNAVVTEALATVAKQLLRDKQRTIQETAYDLGFSDTSTFHRAFKRWTGMTPSAFRDAPRDTDARG